jgi:hypothetical protein
MKSSLEVRYSQRGIFSSKHILSYDKIGTLAMESRDYILEIAIQRCHRTSHYFHNLSLDIADIKLVTEARCV